jgi:hypothetical protein
MSAIGSVLAQAAAAHLTAAGLSEAHTQGEQFVMGLVANPFLSGSQGVLVLNVYASVASDGTGFGLLADPVHPGVNSDLRFHSRKRDGDRHRWEGEVIKSNDPTLVGQPFVLSATVAGSAAAPLDLVIMGETYSGRGLVVIAIIAILIGLLLPAVDGSDWRR